jgi:hypothetical protein
MMKWKGFGMKNSWNFPTGAEGKLRNLSQDTK